MITRALAVSALASGPLRARPEPAGSASEPHRVFKLIYDRGFPEGVAFGAEATRLGAPAQAVGSDLGYAWFTEIEPRWSRGPAVVAGFTSGAALFCLELLARDYGMEVVYRAEHSPAAGRHVRHVIEGPERLRVWESSLNAAGNQWPAMAATLALNCPRTLNPDPSTGLLDLGRSPRVAGDAMFSWLIAPAERPHVLGSRYPERRERV